MDDARKKKLARAGKVGVATLALIAFVIVCTGIGKLHVNPFGKECVEGASVASDNESGTVIADRAGRRLLFVSPEGKLRGVYGMESRETPIDEVSTIRQAGNTVFVAGIKSAEDGERIKTEAVLRFDMSGTYQGVAWKRDYQDDDIRVTRSIADVACDADGNVILVRFADQKMHAAQLDISVTKLTGNDGGEEELRKPVHPKDSFPFDARIDEIAGNIALSDTNGVLYVDKSGTDEAEPVMTGDRTVLAQAFDLQGNTAILYDQDSGTVLRADDFFGEVRLSEIERDSPRIDNIRIEGDCVSTVASDGIVRLFDLANGSSRDIVEIPLSTSLWMSETLRYACYAYLSVLTLALLIRWVVRTIRKGERIKIRNAIIATAVTLICGAALYVHMTSMVAATIGTRSSTMSQIVAQASATSPAEFGDAATRAARSAISGVPDDTYGTDLSTMINNVESILTSSFANTNGVQPTIYALDEHGGARILLDSQRDSIVMSEARGQEVADAIRIVVQKANGYEGNGEDRAYRFSHEERPEIAIRDDRAGRTVISCIAPLISKDGTCCTAIEVTCRMESLLTNIMDNMGGFVLLFAMIAASIYVVSDELLRSGSAYLRFKELKEEGVEWAETLLGRPLAFVINIAFGMDTAFAVVIAKDMLAGSDIASTSLVWGIPAFAIAMGTTLGTIYHAIMSSRFSARRYTLSLTLVGAAAQVAAGIAVWQGWFAVFVACKLASSASLAGLNLVYQNLAGVCEKQDLGDARLQTLLCRSSADISAKGAGVVASVIGGALAISGNQWVYAAGALATLAIIPLALIALPRGRVLSKRDERVGLSNAFEFLRSPVMLATLAFAIFPTVLASGYKSYILPLFLDSSGISKTDIASLFALGNVLLFAFTEPLINSRDAQGRWKLTWTALLGLGGLFCLFAFNQTPMWAVVAVIAITLLLWLAGDWKHTARGWAREDHGFAFDQSQSMLNLENAVVSNAQAPVLSALVSMGATPCCLVLGLFLFVSGVGYYLPTRSREG